MKVLIACFSLLCGVAIANAELSTPSPTAAAAPTVEEMSLESVEIADTNAIETEGDAAISCGGKFCSAGTYCCNASCGTCVPKGMSCTQQSCN